MSNNVISDTNVSEIKLAEITSPIKYIPKTFMVKVNNWVIKVSYEKHYSEYYGKGYLDATYYVSRSKSTWKGVMKYYDGAIKLLSGIFIFETYEYYKFKSVSKITVDENEIIKIITDKCRDLKIRKSIIEFNNWSYTIHINYNIKKAPLIQFSNPMKQGNLYIACINKYNLFIPPSECYLHPEQIDNKYFTKIYNHTISCNIPFTIIKPIFTGGGEFIIIDFTGIPENETTIEITSPEHETIKFSVKTNNSLLLYHPKPIKKID